MDKYITPPNHYGFKAKQISGMVNGMVSDCSVAYIEPKGGGPDPSHTHEHDHFFIVIDGIATIKIGEDTHRIKMDESILVPGSMVHSIWNETEQPLKMIGMTINHDKLI